MASKKRLKKYIKELERQNLELFNQSVARAEEIARIDVMLHDAEFPGPTIEAYVAQTQQFLQRLVEERGLRKKSSMGESVVVPMAPSISERGSGSYLSIAPENEAEDNGEYEFLQPSDVNRLGTDAT